MKPVGARTRCKLVELSTTESQQPNKTNLVHRSEKRSQKKRKIRTPCKFSNIHLPTFRLLRFWSPRGVSRISSLFQGCIRTRGWLSKEGKEVDLIVPALVSFFSSFHCFSLALTRWFCLGGYHRLFLVRRGIGRLPRSPPPFRFDQLSAISLHKISISCAPPSLRGPFCRRRRPG